MKVTPNPLDVLDSTILDEMDGPILLRELAYMFIQEAKQSDDPIAFYDRGIEKILSLYIEEGTRLESTQKYVIRIFEQRQRQYEEALTRDISMRPEDIMNSATSEESINLDS